MSGILFVDGIHSKRILVLFLESSNVKQELFVVENPIKGVKRQ